MGKLIYAIFILFFIQAAAILYLGVPFPGTSLYNAITGVEEWSSTNFINYMTDTLAMLGGIGIVVGLYFVKSDFVFYAALGLVFFSFGMTYFEMYQKINGAIGGFIPQQILILFMVPLILPWTFIILDWIRGRD